MKLNELVKDGLRLTALSVRTTEDLVTTRAEDKLRIGSEGTQTIMRKIRKSVIEATNLQNGEVQFIGEMKDPSSKTVIVAGRGVQSEKGIRISGQFDFRNSGDQIRFIVERFRMGEGDIENVMKLYERQIAGKSTKEILEINKEFGEIFELVNRQAEDNGNTVMYVIDPKNSEDVRPKVKGLNEVPVLRRVATKIGFGLAFKQGMSIGKFGEIVPKKSKDQLQITKRQDLLGE